MIRLATATAISNLKGRLNELEIFWGKGRVFFFFLLFPSCGLPKLFFLFL